MRISGQGGSSDALPMVIALHGNGDTPDNFYDTLLKRFHEPARFILLRGPLDYSGGRFGGRAWPTRVEAIKEYGDALTDAVPVLKEEYPTVGRPVVLGFSGGAYMAYYLAAYHADRFSYIFPLSGRLSGVQASTEPVSFEDGAKVIAFHGRNDQLIAYSNGVAAVNRLQERGADAELVTVDDGHLSVFMSGNDLLMDYLSDAVTEITP